MTPAERNALLARKGIVFAALSIPLFPTTSAPQRNTVMTSATPQQPTNLDPDTAKKFAAIAPILGISDPTDIAAICNAFADLADIAFPPESAPSGPQNLTSDTSPGMPASPGKLSARDLQLCREEGCDPLTYATLKARRAVRGGL